jgi:hypothetical protein
MIAAAKKGNPMFQEFSAQYFYSSNGFGSPNPNQVRQATLTDIDLLRGNTAGEAVMQTGTTGQFLTALRVFSQLAREYLSGFRTMSVGSTTAKSRQR